LRRQGTQPPASPATVLRQYVYGAQYIDEVVCKIEDPGGTPGKLFYLHDCNYNVVALTNTSGEVQERYNYEPYGGLTIANAGWTTRDPHQTTQNNSLTFQGQRYDAESGLYYFRNRYLSPVLGRFMQRDRRRYDDGLNLYQAERSNPVTKLDPTGQKTPWGCIVCGCCAGVAMGECSALCAGGKWDTPGEGFGSCFKKCLRASLTASKGFTVTCVVACGACVGELLDAAIGAAQGGDDGGAGQGGDEQTAPDNTRTPGRGQEPNSEKTFPDGKGGSTTRQYDEEGKATKDIDRGHDHGAGDPHVHDWDWSKGPPRGPGRPPKPGEFSR